MPLSVDRRALVLVLVAALAVRIAAAVWWEQRLPAGHRFGLADSESYWTLGKAIAHQLPYEYGGRDARVFRTPAYPLLLAAIIGVAGDTSIAVWTARLVGALLGTLSIALLMIWTALLFPTRNAPLFAGLVAAFYPGLIALSVILLSEALFCPLIVAQLVCWTRAEQQTSGSRWAWSTAAGLLAGAATLSRPSWFLFIPFAGAIGIIAGQNRTRRAAMLLVMLAAMAVTMMPWWLRNYRIVGRFVPTTLQVGASLYDGLNPRATGASNMWFANDYYRQLEQERRDGRLGDEPLEVALDRRLRHDALQWARAHPARAMQLSVIKFSRMWNVWPNDEQFRSLPVRLAIAVAYVPVIVLALVGAWRFVRQGFVYGLCILPAVYLTALHIVFVSSLRYREPAMIGGIVLAAGVLCASCHHQPHVDTVSRGQ
jgi:4-amino-4-deoxy-L-arabinose transferase-like glycosyltransferase